MRQIEDLVVSRDEERALAQRPVLQFMELLPNRPPAACDPHPGLQWCAHRVEAAGAWRMMLGSVDGNATELAKFAGQGAARLVTNR